VRVESQTGVALCACARCDTRQTAKRGSGRSTTQRVGLRQASGNGSDELSCDVCQMNPAYVICHEDRAFLCRVCDVSIHEANATSRKHQRFLFANTRVELEAMGAGEEAGTRMSPSDSAAEHTVPQFEQEEVGRKRKYNRQQKASVPSEDATVPSIDDLAPGVFENFMTGLLGEEEGRKHMEKSTADENNFWGDIFSENWAAMDGMMDDELAVPNFDQQVPTNAMY